jgi:allophanate hydrolase subunit 2
MGATLIEPGQAPAPLRTPAAFALGTGARLVLGRADRGARAYLAVRRGWQTPVVLWSRSSETPLRAGEVIPGESGWTPRRHLAPEDDPFAAVDDAPIRVVDGPDVLSLSAGALDPGAAYVVQSQSDRMGLRLDGPSVAVAPDPDRVSTPVAPGAVQIAGGRPLILGVACGTMGGYPHVAHVISADLDRLGQARPGDVVRFARVSFEEARAVDRDARRASARRLDRVATAARDRPGWP